MRILFHFSQFLPPNTQNKPKSGLSFSSFQFHQIIMDYFESIESSTDPYKLLFNAATLIPRSHYFLGFVFASVVYLYNYLDFHFVEDLFTGFRGSPVTLTYNSCSEIYDGVVSKCRILHGRYLATPWLSSPHLQTILLGIVGRPTAFRYRRQLFHASDGGTFALDWLLNSDVLGSSVNKDDFISKQDTTPIAVVIPGLTSDSASDYIKHLAYYTAKRGWNVVICNHRGLGGISITSDCFYNAGWTKDTRDVLNYLHHEYPNAPLFAIGTSIGANILVKYLGENGENVPIAGAAAVCCPWDLLIGSRFIVRRLVQKLYDRALTIGLQGYAQLNQPHFSRLADWEGIIKSRSIRDFDTSTTCLFGKFETVDTYYRWSSSAPFTRNVSVPLLCISSLDDPVCTAEAIPWDECRANKNIVLATTKHGGHLAFFEGIAPSGLWWVRAVNEFLGVLYSSPFMHTQKKTQSNGRSSGLESLIDQGPYVNVNDGMVSAMGNEPTANNIVEEPPTRHGIQDRYGPEMVTDKLVEHPKSDCVSEIVETDIEASASIKDVKLLDVTKTGRLLDQLSRQNRKSIWLLAYIAVVSSWPFLDTALRFIFKNKSRKV